MPKAAAAVLLTWAVPGAGHWYLGFKKKAVFYFVALTATYVAGMAIADFRNISLDRHPIFFWATYIFYGGATLVAHLTTHSLPLVAQLEHMDVGCLYSAVAGLLNVLVMIDVYLLTSGYASHAPDR